MNSSETKTWRRIAPMVLTAGLAVAACGGAEEEAVVEPAETEQVESEQTEEAEAETEVEETTTTTEAPDREEDLRQVAAQEIEAALAGTTPGVPDGAPTVFTGALVLNQSADVEVAFTETPRPLSLTGSGEGDDGSAMEIVMGVFDRRSNNTGPVLCNGETHSDGQTQDTDLPTKGPMTIDGWGTIALFFERQTAAFASDLAPPFCEEQTGVWVGLDGEFEGRSGEIHRLHEFVDETFTLSG